MISSRACDLCASPLQSDVVRLTTRRGQVAFLVQQRWRIQARPAGMQQLTICRSCHDYLANALTHLIESMKHGQDSTQPREENAA